MLRAVVRGFSLAVISVLLAAVSLSAQKPQAPAPPADSAKAAAAVAPASPDYVVGPQDVLTITSYDQADLTGKFSVEADGTFTYPMIGRFKAGGLTLQQIEKGLKNELKTEGYFVNPQLTVSVDQYKSQKVYIVGEVRTPGAYALSGNMSLVEILARAGSTLPSASGEAVIVHGGDTAQGPTLPTKEENGKDVVRVNLRQLENGVFSQNAQLRDGDTIFVPRAESVYVFGQVKNPGAYALQQKSDHYRRVARDHHQATPERGAQRRPRVLGASRRERGTARGRDSGDCRIQPAHPGECFRFRHPCGGSDISSSQITSAAGLISSTPGQPVFYPAGSGCCA